MCTIVFDCIEKFAKWLLEFVKASENYAWPIGLLLIVGTFKVQVQQILASIANKLNWLQHVEVGNIKILGPDIKNQAELKEADVTILSASSDISKKRHNIYERQRNIFLVHSVRPTGKTYQENEKKIFDLSIYLMAHKTYGRINDISYVEYYLGEFFKDGNKEDKYGSIYKVTNGTNGFPLKTSAYGPMLCCAKIIFHDSTYIELERYIDFGGFN